MCSPLVISRLTLAAATVAVVGCRQGVDLEVSQKFSAAQQAFNEAESPADFRGVAARYQEILDRGVISGAVLYNQGNAWMRADCPGRAIAAYRQARRYRPRDPYLEANLRYALATDRTAARRRPMIEYLLFWQNRLSYPAKFHLTAAAAFVAFVLGVIGLFVARRLLGRLAVAGVALTALLAFSAGYDWYRYDHIVHGVVVREEVTARKGDSADYEPAFTEPLGEGTEFRLLGRRNGWMLIRLAEGQEGWIEDDAAVVY